MLRTIRREPLGKNFTAFVAALLLLAVAASAGYAGQPVIWETSGRAELLKGDARGVSISDTGMLMLAPRLTEIFNTEQAFVWSSAVDGQGNVYLGTGHDGKIYRVSPEGRGALLYDAAELDVTSLTTGRDGAVYAGTSPDGKVYRIAADGRAEVFFDPADKYIWSLAVLNDGSLAVGTGDNGGVHTNSTIASHAFYLAVEGGTNRTSGLRVTGVGATNRLQMERVFYRAFAQLMPSNANFAMARTVTLQAAQDLYGTTSAAYAAVRDAWTAVGVS